jgi:ABC-type glycerol-3-phosphate transport system substrate-binding protein
MQSKTCRFSLLFFAVAQIWLGAGCGCHPSSPPTQPAQPYEGAALRIACPGGPAGEIVRRYAPGWARHNGATADIATYDSKQSPDSIDRADVWVIAPWQLGRWAATGDLLPLPESLVEPDNPNWTGLLPMERDQLLRWGRSFYALPVCGEAPLCFYRTDFFQQAQKTPPASWQEFEKTAAYFQQHLPAGFQGHVLSALPEDPDALDREFFSVAAPMARKAARTQDRQRVSDTEMFSFHYNLDTGQRRISEPGFVGALCLLQKLQAFRPPGTSAAPPEAFRDGKAILCLADASWIAKFQGPNSAVRDKFGVFQIPGSREVYSFQTGDPEKVSPINRVPYLGAGGWLAVVPKTSPHPNAAFALLAELAGENTSSQIVMEPKWGAGPIRGDQLANNNNNWNGYRLSDKHRDQLILELTLTLTHPGLKNPAFRLRIPEEQEHQQALLAEVRAALLEGKDAAAALNSAAERWKVLDQKKPVTDDYLRSLGIEPR